MNKSINAISLGLLIGFAVSFLPIQSQIFIIVPTALALWDRFDEFNFGGSSHE